MIRLASSLLLFVGLVWSAGCSRTEPDVRPPPAPPDEDQIQVDLVGQTFVFFEDGDGPREWTIEADEIRDFQIVDTVRAGDPNRLRARTRIVLVAPTRTIQGELRLDYLHTNVGWEVQGVQRVGPNFIAGDASFVLFDVSPLTEDTLGNSRGLGLDVIARYEDGGFVAPFDGFRSRMDALADSIFLSDSLRQIAEAKLGTEIGRAFVRAGASVRVLRPGEPPQTVRARNVEVGVVGCEYLHAEAPSRISLGQDAALATTSSVLGGAVAPGRRLTADEGRQLDRLARERLRVQGLDAQRVRSGGSLAIDLDGDGAEDWVGTFTVGDIESGTARGIVLGAKPNSTGAPVLLFERMTAPGFGSFTLVGAVDMDADRAADVVWLEEGAEVYQYLIVTHRAGRFVTAFRGGGGGC